MGTQPSRHVKLEHRVPLLTEMQQLSLDIDRKYGPSSPTPAVAPPAANIPSTTTICSYSPPTHTHTCSHASMMMPPPSMLSAPLGPATGSPAGLLSAHQEPPFGFCTCCTAPLPPPTPLPGSRCEQHRREQLLQRSRSLSGLRLRSRLRSMMLCGGGGGCETDEKKQSRGLRLRSRKKGGSRGGDKRGGRWDAASDDDDGDNASLADSFTTGSSLRSVRSGKLVMMTGLGRRIMI